VISGGFHQQICRTPRKFSDDVAQEAVDGLDKHDGRPNPSTLAFITKRLYEEDRDDEAKVFQDLQSASAILLPAMSRI